MPTDTRQPNRKAISRNTDLYRLGRNGDPRCDDLRAWAREYDAPEWVFTLIDIAREDGFQAGRNSVHTEQAREIRVGKFHVSPQNFTDAAKDQRDLSVTYAYFPGQVASLPTVTISPGRVRIELPEGSA